jgi:signal transduction histidine kinase
VSRAGFRTRLFAILTLFAIVPALVMTIAWGGLIGRGLPLVSGTGAWERTANSGTRALRELETARLSEAQRTALRAHEAELQESLIQARRFRFLAERAVPLLIVGALLSLAVLTWISSRVAGHLSRQLSRPIDELVGWTALIGRGEPLPEGPPRRGAPEFAVLRNGMRAMSTELAAGRARELEAERLTAFRETARRVAHELKNPLTPIRFAVARLKRESRPEIADAVEVLDVESRRLEELARDFSRFGRLPEGPMAEVDLGELARYTARAVVPPEVDVEVTVDENVPFVHGHHDALARAFSNVMLNAVDACRAAQSAGVGTEAGMGRIMVHVSRAGSNGSELVRVVFRDTGPGIPADQLERIWEPYVTQKVGGTGLGLAITRQAILMHAGTVEASSTPGIGTEFVVTLPASHVPQQSNGGTD